MPFVDTGSLDKIERLPGWRGRYFHSPSMTFAHYEFTAGASIHEHYHPQEEVYEVIEGELEVIRGSASALGQDVQSWSDAECWLQAGDEKSDAN